MKRLLQYSILVLLIGLIVVGLHTFFIGSYCISTDSMANTLKKGDFVLVNKLLYEKANPGFGRIVLFKSPLTKDSISPPLFISRCVGMPGDTIQISNEGYRINGFLVPNTDSGRKLFVLETIFKPSLLSVLEEQKITYKSISEDSLHIVIELNTEEEKKLQEKLLNKVKIEQISEPNLSFRFVIPQKGYTYQLDSSTLLVYQEAILKESNGKADYRNGKLFIEGKEITSFSFQQNYYWMLSDNVNHAIDSRHLGLIPLRSIIGNIWFCWFSKDKNRMFRWIN